MGEALLLCTHKNVKIKCVAGWNNVCTQLSFVWIFATVITTSLSILDCTDGTEGFLIMDPSVTCPLASEAVFWWIPSIVKSGNCDPNPNFDVDDL